MTRSKNSLYEIKLNAGERFVKTVGIIPARWQSSRFPGKPLADICGKPMIQWVYDQARKVQQLETVYVATDNVEIENVCKAARIPCIMTKDSHPTHIHRVHEISKFIEADYYIAICGDEPLIESEVIKTVLPPTDINEKMYVAGLCRYFTDPAEVIDPANIKVVTNSEDECVMLSRSPVPFPYKTVMFKYKKTIGVECYSKSALDFFVSKEKGLLESVEDVTLQRYLENRIPVIYKLVDSVSLSVDTIRDLEKVRDMIAKKEHYL